MIPHWLVRPATIRCLWIAFAAVLAATVLAEFLIERHPATGLDALFGFNAWLGFGVCVALVMLARLLGGVLKRPDDYYGQ